MLVSNIESVLGGGRRLKSIKLSFFIIFLMVLGKLFEKEPEDNQIECNDSKWKDRFDQKYCIQGSLFLAGLPAIAG